MSIMLLGFLLLELLLKDINILVRIFVNSRPRSRSISYRNIDSAYAQSNVPLDRYTMSRLIYVFN